MNYDKMMDFREMIELAEWIGKEKDGKEIEFEDLVDEFMAENGIAQYECSFDHVYDSPGCDVYAFALACVGSNGKLYYENGYFSRY